MGIAAGYTTADLGAICFLAFKVQRALFNKDLHQFDSLAESPACFLLGSQVIDILGYGNLLAC